jgi:hypothetical protein
MRKDSKLIIAELEFARFVAPLGSVWLHKHGGHYMVTGYSYSTGYQEAEIRYTRIAGPDFKYDYDSRIPYTRRMSEWTTDRFTRQNRSESDEA